MRFDSLITNVELEGSGFVIRDNVIINNRGRGMQIKAGNGVIERNSILGPAWWGMQVRRSLPFLPLADTLSAQSSG